MADTKDKDSIKPLYDQLLPQLADKLYQQLTEVVPLFDDFSLERVADTWTKDRDNPSDKPISLENGNVAQIGLKLQLLGFQRAGVTSFDIAKDLVLKLEHTTYSVGPDKNTTWVEKRYFQPWTPQELDDVAERLASEVIDAITEQLRQNS
ncbi:hypothetical protein [Rufibacter sp. LB8]|nr:hypothetical protein [Rufibacter sp. LB8]